MSAQPEPSAREVWQMFASISALIVLIALCALGVFK